MQLITKHEAFAMREQGLQSYVMKSKSRHPKYYIVEDKRALSALEIYRKNRIINEYKN